MLHDCFICHSEMGFYFNKHFTCHDLGVVDYWKCSNCGFVISQKHVEMNDVLWSHLNVSWHQENNLLKDSPYRRNERHFAQAVMITVLAQAGLISDELWLDWGCGDGGVALQLMHHFNRKLYCYDPFISSAINPVASSELNPRSYNMVLNTAVFEHLRSRTSIDEIESYVTSKGCFAIHTLVRGEIPADPEWMYLLPVHSIFFTNRSMHLLMEQWGYTCSVYNPIAKLWVLFKESPDLISNRVKQLNFTLGWQALHFKIGFVDYWP